MWCTSGSLFVLSGSIVHHVETNSSSVDNVNSVLKAREKLVRLAGVIEITNLWACHKDGKPTINKINWHGGWHEEKYKYLYEMFSH